MTMSMYSSYSPEDFHPEEDIFGKFRRNSTATGIGIHSSSITTTRLRYSEEGEEICEDCPE